MSTNIHYEKLRDPDSTVVESTVATRIATNISGAISGYNVGLAVNNSVLVASLTSIFTPEMRSLFDDYKITMQIRPAVDGRSGKPLIN